METTTAGNRLTVGSVAMNRWNAIGIVAIGGVNAHGVIAIGGGNVTSLLPAS